MKKKTPFIYQKLFFLSTFKLFTVMMWLCCMMAHASPNNRAKRLIQNDVSLCEIKGTVLDGNKLPLPGARIEIVGTQIRTVSDLKGQYKFMLNGGHSYVMRVNYVGMQQYEIRLDIDPKDTTKRLSDIIMTYKDSKLLEVVVTGYQVLSRRKSASAITSVRADRILQPDVMNIDQMLEGKVPGMTVMVESGEPGATPTIRIRGNSTINGNKAPVWVVDGVILSDPVPFSASDLNSPDAPYLIGNSISGISPQDISTIDVLKDASATAIYGVKAANGVIVITTKKGIAGKPKVSYDGGYTINSRPSYRMFNQMNSQERIQLSKELYEDRLQYPAVPPKLSYEGALSELFARKITQEQFEALVRRYEIMNTDWFRELFRSAFLQNHNLSVSGGSDRVKYYTSVSYNNSPGIALHSSSQRYTGLAKLAIDLTKTLSAEVKLNVSSQNREGYSQMAGLNPFRYAFKTSRAIPLREDDGQLHFYRRASIPVSFNILNELRQTNKVSKTDAMDAMLNLNWKILPSLTYIGTFSYGKSNHKDFDRTTDHSHYVSKIRGYDYDLYTKDDEQYKNSPIPFGGIYSTTQMTSRYYTLRNTLDYKRRVNMLYDLNLFVGMEVRSETYEGLETYNYGWDPNYGQTFAPVHTNRYQSAVASGVFLPRITERMTQVASFFGSASYTYLNRYILNANIRSDGSNKFGTNPKYRWLPTWSVAGKWFISQESFAKKISWIDHLSIRGSYGTQGNIHPEATPHLIVKMGNVDAISGIRTGKIDRLPNPDLRWEKTQSYNLGMDMTLFDSRMGVTLDVYRKNTTDLVTYLNVSPVTGRTQIRMNAGRLYNKGFEGSVRVEPIRSKNWSWDVSFNFSNNINEIKYAVEAVLNERETAKEMLTGNVAVKGYPLGTIFSFKYKGLTKDMGLPQFESKDGRYVLDGNVEAMALAPSGSIYPSLAGGIDTRLTFRKNLTLSIGLNYQLGAVKRLPMLYSNAALRAFNPEENAPRDFISRWREPGDENQTNIPSLIHMQHFNIPSELKALGGNDVDLSITRNFFYDRSDIRVAKSDYLRLRQVTLSYRIPEALLKAYHITSATVRIQANNLWTWAAKEWNGMDPGTAYANMPIMPGYSLGLNLNF